MLGSFFKNRKKHMRHLIGHSKQTDSDKVQIIRGYLPQKYVRQSGGFLGIKIEDDYFFKRS